METATEGSQVQVKLPTFLIFGVQKAGTTSIYQYLKQHPQVYVSPHKETNFFSRDWETATPEEKAKKRNGINSFEKYVELFRDAKDEIAIGEASPNYLLYYETSAALIQRYLPNAKLIAMLRNPVDRAYSDYLMHVRDILGPGHRLAYQAQERSQQSHTIRKGFYYAGIKQYLDVFGAEQVKVYLYDDFCKDPLSVMQDMYRFIGVDDTFAPDMTYRAQVAKIPKNRSINQLLQEKNPVRTAAAAALKFVLPVETRQKIRQRLLDMNFKGKSSELLTPQERQLLVDLYRDDILKLQDLLGRDLSNWLT
jgi:Sulfotransferase family